MERTDALNSKIKLYQYSNSINITVLLIVYKKDTPSDL